MTDVMTNEPQVLNIFLDSTNEGAVPRVSPETINVAQGGEVQICVTWPENETDTISGILCFNGDTQDPFNDLQNGQTTFTVTRPNDGSPGKTGAFEICSDAALGTDSYTVKLEVANQLFGVDPKIRVVKR